MTGHEHHPELVIVERLPLRPPAAPFGGRPSAARGLGAARPRPCASTMRSWRSTVERAIARHAKQPRRRILGHAAIRPLLQRGDQRVLHRLLGERQMPAPSVRVSVATICADCRRNRCSRIAGTVTVAIGGRAQAVGSTSRISIEPNSRCGQSCAERHDFVVALRLRR